MSEKDTHAAALFMELTVRIPEPDIFEEEYKLHLGNAVQLRRRDVL